MSKCYDSLLRPELCARIQEGPFIDTRSHGGSSFLVVPIFTLCLEKIAKGFAGSGEARETDLATSGKKNAMVKGEMRSDGPLMPRTGLSKRSGKTKHTERRWNLASYDRYRNTEGLI